MVEATVVEGKPLVFVRKEGNLLTANLVCGRNSSSKMCGYRFGGTGHQGGGFQQWVSHTSPPPASTGMQEINT